MNLSDKKLQEGLKNNKAYTRKEWGNQYIALGSDEKIRFYDYDELPSFFIPDFQDLSASNFIEY